MQQTIHLIKEAIAYMKEDSRLIGMTGIVPLDQVKGKRQECDSEFFDHEFVDQQCQFDDDYWGTVYLPLPTGEYMAMEFTTA